uniref:SAC domain-containing protein n=1 Tax=Panagrellus redivivus TaxID=6233 RepID=A0A7E5A0L7_PANRE
MRLTCLDIYETPSHFYIIGTDAAKLKYSVLKLDRNTPNSFTIGEPNHEYTKKDVDEMLSTISSSSVVATRRGAGGSNALLQTIKSAFGIIGAVRFLEGYHLIVVTRAKAIALLGHHEIYKIEEVQSIYIPAAVNGPLSADEQRYAKLFQSVDLTTNFYFSFTYDLSRTFQENALAQKRLSFNKNQYHPQIDAERKFIWNDYLLKPFQDNLITDKWTIEIVHGFVGQQIIELPCSKLALILIGRRSAVYAGTRFLKRGMNFAGAVANDVETEQIVWDMWSTPNIDTGKFTSFVQRRGSIPLFWSQDPSTRAVVGKPMVFIDLVEPNAFTTAAHFRELRRKYGYPVSIVNLVKRRGGPKTYDEKNLHDQFLKTVHYLNDFMKPGKCIDYISFDVARCNKSGLVLPRLEFIGQKLILRQGWFQSFAPLRCRELDPHPLLESWKPRFSSDGTMLLQSGISRTNCVDCLDRTNVAQFGLGKVALGFQLHAMGYLPEPFVSTNSELCRAYEDLFDEHGDTMAWQYAGSQLVHSIKTYKKTSALQERSRDVIQTISRYYSNTFNDSEKQNGINLFLGVFRPFEQIRPHLWDLMTDRYLHLPIRRDQRVSHRAWVENVHSESEGEEDEDWEDWFELVPNDRAVYGSEVYKPTLEPLGPVPRTILPDADTMYWRFHREWEITNFEAVLKENNIQTSKRFMSVLDLNQSAFQGMSFMKLWKSPDTASETSKKPFDEDDDDDDEIERDDSDDELRFDEDRNFPSFSSSSRQTTMSPVPRSMSKSPAPTDGLTIDRVLPTTEAVFGFEVGDPSGDDLKMYEKYANIAAAERVEEPVPISGFMSSPRSSLRAHEILKPSFFTVDNVFETDIVGITDETLTTYKNYVDLGDYFVPKNNISVGMGY